MTPEQRSMATRLSRIISQFYEDPENVRRYQAWLEANARKRAENEKRGPATNDSRALSETGRTAAYHIAATSC